MEKKQLHELRKARQEVADIFATTLLDMILDGKTASNDDGNLGRQPHLNLGGTPMESRPCH